MESGLVLLVGLAAAAGIGAWRRSESTREQLAIWRAAMQACELDGVEVSSSWSARLTGTRAGLRVHISEYKRDKYSSRLRVEVVPRARFDLDLRRESLGTAVEKRLGSAREIEIGDASFDESFFLSGVPARVRARLDAKTRAMLLTLQGQLADVRLSDGVLTCELEDSQPDLRELKRVLRSVLALARRLADAASTASRLAAIVRADPLPEVRMQCLLTLVRDFENQTETSQALTGACADADPQVRLRAAMARGEGGTETLLALARDRGVADAVSARAVAALGARLDVASALALLAQPAGAGRHATALACIERLGASGSDKAVAPLVAMLRTHPPRLAAPAAEALGALGAAQAEGPLVEALERQSEEVLAAVARALGRVGSVAAVPALREAGERALERDTHRAMREAVAQIQSRVSGASPGQLSLASAEAGQLSLTSDEAGQVSLAPSNGRAALPRADST